MVEKTGISWCDSTYNPWIGCTKVSPACDNCYAERENTRFKWVPAFGNNIPRKRTKTAKDVRKWQREAAEFFAKHGRRRRLFCASLADVFDNQVPHEWRDDLWRLVRDTPDIIWMILTKRIGNAKEMLPDDWGYSTGYPNVMLMATICNQREAERDVPKLLLTGARWRALSVEPMLGRVDLTKLLRPDGSLLDALAGTLSHDDMVHPDLNRLDLVIGGGESMPAGMASFARPVHPIEARFLRDQCARAGVAFHWKQWGEWSDATNLPNEKNPLGISPVHGEGQIITTFRDGTEAALLGVDNTGRAIDGVEHDGWPESAI